MKDTGCQRSLQQNNSECLFVEQFSGWRVKVGGGSFFTRSISCLGCDCADLHGGKSNTNFETLTVIDRYTNSELIRANSIH